MQNINDVNTISKLDEIINVIQCIPMHDSDDVNNVVIMFDEPVRDAADELLHRSFDPCLNNNKNTVASYIA